MSETKKTVGFKMSQETINKLDEALRLRNEQLSIAGATINKQDYIEELINNDYYRLQGQTNDVDTVNKINQYIDDGLETKLSNVESKVDSIFFQNTRRNKLMDVFMRVAIGTKDEKIKKLLGTFDGYGSADNQEEAEEMYNEWLNIMLSEPSPLVEAVDTLLYQDDDE